MRERVGVEPSGEAFNEMSLDPDTGRPRNPMINAGAILTHSLVDGDDAKHRAEQVLDAFSRYAGRRLTFDESVYVSELSSAYRNSGMGHMLKAAGVLDGDPVEAVGGYIRQCSIRVTCRDLALMAATLANGGVQPKTGETVLDDAAGDWMTSVGIPAKSGVFGGIFGALPGQVGIAVFSPRLDSHGTSVRGVEVFTRLSRDMGMHMMDADQEGQDALRGHLVSGGDSPVTVYRLQGDLRFAEPRPSSARSALPSTRPTGSPSTSAGSIGCTTWRGGCCSRSHAASPWTGSRWCSSIPRPWCPTRTWETASA